MVKIQIDLPDNLNKFIEVRRVLLGLKDKRKTILVIIKENLEAYKGLNLKEELNNIIKIYPR